MSRRLRATLMPVGSRFGFLTVMFREGRIGKNASYRCKCDCGEEVVVRGDRLRSGLRKACAVNGHRAIGDPEFVTAHKPEYRSFRNMHDRCNAKKGSEFKNYGSRGIKVCARWSSFRNFMEDMGPKPDPKYTIERVNNDGNYEQTNCCWILPGEQQRNRRNSVYVEYEGERTYLPDLIKRLGLNTMAVRGRLINGWNLVNAITKPVRRKKKNSP